MARSGYPFAAAFQHGASIRCESNDSGGATRKPSGERCQAR